VRRARALPRSSPSKDPLRPLERARRYIPYCIRIRDQIRSSVHTALPQHWPGRRVGAWPRTIRRAWSVAHEVSRVIAAASTEDAPKRRLGYQNHQTLGTAYCLLTAFRSSTMMSVRPLDSACFSAAAHSASNSGSRASSRATTALDSNGTFDFAADWQATW
jgi:hypothetical protein